MKQLLLLGITLLCLSSCKKEIQVPVMECGEGNALATFEEFQNKASGKWELVALENSRLFNYGRYEEDANYQIIIDTSLYERGNSTNRNWVLLEIMTVRQVVGAANDTVKQDYRIEVILDKVRIQSNVSSNAVPPMYFIHFCDNEFMVTILNSDGEYVGYEYFRKL